MRGNFSFNRRKLLLLLALGGGGGTIVTVTGVSPLALVNALAKPIKSLTQYGKCVQASAPTPSAPVDIVCNNGALRYSALGRNLLDPSAANTVLEYYINKADGEEKPSPPNFMFANYMPVVGGKTYVAYGRAKEGNDLSDYNRVAWYDSTKTWISGADYTQNRIAVVTAPANAAYARFSCNPTGTTTTVVTQELVDSYNWMFAEGTAEITPFVPFEGGIHADGTPEVLTVGARGETPQSASVVDLFAVGDYADNQDIISGAITHKVGIKVLDGSEEWIDGSNGYITEAVQDQSGDTYTPVCTHFRGTNTAPQKNSGTVRVYRTSGGTGRVYFAPNMTTYPTKEDFAAWLAEQYAAGTPVIVFYALAEETTGQTTPHSLHTSAGDNVVSVTSEVDPVELKVEYTAQPTP